ncbi:MAG TPA: T9SS type A sorting domain-containing protein [Puia sp.]|nr:T9SS type A sorting domain-containing protein [Puia sp.]
MMHPVDPKKTKLSANLKGGVMALSLALFLQCSAHAAFAISGGTTSPTPDTGSGTIHSIQVSKAQSSKKHKIRLYPDARQQVLFFSANGEDGKVYQLYLFDMDGRLVNQAQIRNKETTVLTTISEGNYLFEVFTDDERIENGQLTVR